MTLDWLRAIAAFMSTVVVLSGIIIRDRVVVLAGATAFVLIWVLPIG